MKYIWYYKISGEKVPKKRDIYQFSFSFRPKFSMSKKTLNDFFKIIWDDFLDKYPEIRYLWVSHNNLIFEITSPIEETTLEDMWNNLKGFAKDRYIDIYNPTFYIGKPYPPYLFAILGIGGIITIGIIASIVKKRKK